MNKNSKIHLHDSTVFIGVLIGFFVGAIVWLFRVPKRGEDTRRQIVESGRGLIERDPEDFDQESFG